MEIETTVLIPNFNGEAHLAECLSSLFEQSYQKFKIIFIDNGSIDKSIEHVRNNFPDTDILGLNRNYGFAKAINIGINYSIKKYNPKFIALLNNDAKANKDWLYYLSKSIEFEPKIAAVASNMLFYDSPDIINSQGGTANIIGDGYDINIFRNLKDNNKIQEKVLYPCAGATLLKTARLKEIGIFDERYFAYCEDLDWGWRANLYGYKIIFAEKAIVYHKKSASLRDDNCKKEYLCKRNSLCTIIKNYQLKTLMKMMPFLFWNYLTYPLWALKNKKFPFRKRFEFALIPLKSLSWNIKNIKNSLKLRKTIQLKRRIKDLEIFKLMMKNAT